MPANEERAEEDAGLPSGLPPYLASLYEVPLLTRGSRKPICSAR